MRKTPRIIYEPVDIEDCVFSDTLTARDVYFSVHRTANRNLLVCHKCDNNWCINIDHLFLGTYQDNVWDMINKGRNNCGPYPLDMKEVLAKRAEKLKKWRAKREAEIRARGARGNARNQP